MLNRLDPIAKVLTSRSPASRHDLQAMRERFPGIVEEYVSLMQLHWNQTWEDFFKKNPGAKKPAILRQRNKMLNDFELTRAK
jgi:hypothetical protein